MFFAEAVRKTRARWLRSKFGKEFADYAKNNFKLNGYKNVEVLQGDAKEVIKGLPIKDYHFLFIDGDKTHYLEIFQLLEKRVSKDCIIIFDDAYIMGDIFQ